jgi:hypothetical protein
MPHRAKLLISAPIRPGLAKRLPSQRSSYLTSADGTEWLAAGLKRSAGFG